MFVLILTQTALPLLPIIIDSGKQKVDIFVSNREKRWKYYLISILSYASGILYSLWRGYWIYAVLSLSYMLSSAGLAAVTVFARWKISVHAAGIAGPTTALVLVRGLETSPLYILLIPVAWARLELKAHDLRQLIAGALLAFSTTLVVFSLLA